MLSFQKTVANVANGVALTLDSACAIPLVRGRLNSNIAVGKPYFMNATLYATAAAATSGSAVSCRTTATAELAKWNLGKSGCFFSCALPLLFSRALFFSFSLTNSLTFCLTPSFTR